MKRPPSRRLRPAAALTLALAVSCAAQDPIPNQGQVLKQGELVFAKSCATANLVSAAPSSGWPSRTNSGAAQPPFGNGGAKPMFEFCLPCFGA